MNTDEWGGSGVYMMFLSLAASSLYSGDHPRFTHVSGLGGRCVDLGDHWIMGMEQGREMC